MAHSPKVPTVPPALSASARLPSTADTARVAVPPGVPGTDDPPGSPRSVFVPTLPPPPTQVTEQKHVLLHRSSSMRFPTVWPSTLELSSRDIESVAQSPLFGDGVARSLQTAIAQLPPSPALKPLPTPRPHSAAPLPTFELSSDEIQAITRTPLLASPVPRTRNNEPGTAAETTKAATQQPALEEQSTPLSAKDRSPLVSAEASSLRPRRLLFDDDDSNSEGNRGDEGAQQQHRAATIIQAVWRGHCVRVLFRRACALADDLVATALAGPRRTTLEPVDLSWCFPQPLVAPPPGPESGTVAAAPAVVVPNPARAPSHTRSASATRAPTAGELTRSQRVASTAAATQPKSRGAGTNASRRDSLVRTATLPNITVTGAVPALSSSVRATASQQQQPRCTFQSSCRGMMSEFASSSDNLRGPPRAFVAPVQPPVRNQQQQQRASQRRPLDRSESCTSLAQLHGSRVATAMRAQRLLSETDSGGGASSFTESLRVPADARVHRPSASVTSSPKWNPF